MNPTLAYLLIAAQTLAWLLWLWHRRPQQDTDDHNPLLLLYASQGGQAETLAQTLAPQLGVSAHNLDAWHARHPLKALNHKTLILIASTTGEGAPPDNAVRFTRTLCKQTAPLTGTRYHLLALGDKRYPRYCAYGHTLDRELKRLGAEAASPIATVDNLDPQTIAYWQQQLAAEHNLTLNASVEAPRHDAILRTRTLLNPDSAQPIYHLRLDCPAIPADTALIEVTIPQTNEQEIRDRLSPQAQAALDLLLPEIP